MDSGLVAALIAGVVAVTGYLLSQASQRRERQAKIYADALAALTRWGEVPFAILRRPRSDEEVRAAIGKEISDAMGGVSYHVTLLRLESPPLGEAYRLLWHRLRVTWNQNRDLAWATPVMTTDEEMRKVPSFVREDADEEYALCLLAMRRELKLWGWLLRRDTQRRVDAQRRRRDPHSSG